jgi:hypothetical protein
MATNEDGFMNEISEFEDSVLKIRVDERPFAVKTHRIPVVAPWLDRPV